MKSTVKWSLLGVPHREHLPPAGSVDIVAPSFFSRSGPSQDSSGSPNGEHGARSRVPHGQDSASFDATSARMMPSGDQSVLNVLDSASAFDAALERWRDELSTVTALERSDNAPRLSLAHTHPGGLAQLYAEHTTRLSNLLREPSAYARGLERCREILARSSELANRHGIGTIHLAIGNASWTHNEARLSSPALLRPVFLEEHEGDILVSLTSGAQVAPALARAFAAKGVTIDIDSLMREARTVHGFAPSRALAHIRAIGGALLAFDLRDDLVLGLFEHPAGHLLRELEADAAMAASPIVRALAGDQGIAGKLRSDLPEPNPFDRDPWKERGVGDLTPRQQDVLDALAQGRSLLVDVPHGSDDAGIIAAILAEAGMRGRSTLHIGGAQSRTARLEARLRELGVEEIAVRVDATAESGMQLCERLTTALSDTTPLLSQEALESMRGKLRRTRQTLTNYTTALHAPFRQFGVSPSDALQVLTDITSARPAPRTKVRLREEVLLTIARDQGDQARTLLHRAAQLGVFSRTSHHEAWNGAVINSAEQVPEILERVQRLSRELLPELMTRMEEVVSETGITPPQSIKHWESQLEMLAGVRAALDVFRPAIFERSAADMVIATAPKQWRREHGITLKRSQRLRLVKQAKDMLLPGRHVEDLHRELVLVQEKREVWRRHCDADGWPTLPSRLDEAIALTTAVKADLEWIAPTLATGHPDLIGMGLPSVTRLCDRLAADPEGAVELPKRVAVLKELNGLGLEDLVADLRSRHVDAEALDAELDLAWWASILGLMLTSEQGLGGLEPAHLGEMLTQGRALDVEQVDSLAPQALESLHRLRQHALATRADQHTDLQVALSAAQQSVGSVNALELYAAHPLVGHLLPVVLTLPTLVPWIVPIGHRVDLVVLDDIDALPLSELIPIIARARQVVVVADTVAAREDGPVLRLAEILPVLTQEIEPTRLNDQAARLLSHYGIEHTGIPVPWSFMEAPVNAVWVEGTGMPAPGAHSVESTAAEVDAVVELIIAHAVETPERTLAVIALNERHAERIRDDVKHRVSNQPGLATFFTAETTEPFVVADPTQVSGLSRDRIVIAVGFAKTPHGRVLHDFGLFSTPEGKALMADILRTIRGDLTVVSCIRHDEIDRERLSVQGAQMLVDLLQIAGGQQEIAPNSWPILEAEPDRLLIDLADRLYRVGLEVVPNVGIAGGMRIPLAIGHPEVPGRLLVAVLTDDANYVAEPSLRVRDRMWPAMLEEQGWKVYTALSMAVFIDPTKVADAIVQLVLDAVDDVNGPVQPTVVDLPRIEIEAAELDPEEEAALLSTNEVRARHDELVTGMVHIIGAGNSGSGEESAEVSTDQEATPNHGGQRGPRPAIARGLPLSAYGDDQLDEVAMWIRSDGMERSLSERVEELRSALGIVRRGAQTDAVLANVIRRTEPVVLEVVDGGTSDPLDEEDN